MKIGVSASGKTVNDLLDKRFGRCAYFQIHDTESGEVKVLENEGQNASGGAGILASNQLIEQKVDVILTGNLGPNAFKVINKAGIKAYKCDNVEVSLALEDYKKDKFEEINMAGPAYHGGNK